MRPIVTSTVSPTYHLAKYSATLLKPYMGGNIHHVSNSYEFVKTIQHTRIKLKDILASFDVTSLLTRVPLQDSHRELRKVFPHETTGVFFIMC